MVSVAQLVRAIEGAAMRAGRRSQAARLGRVFDAEMRRPEMVAGFHALEADLSRAPAVEHIAVVRRGEAPIRFTDHSPEMVRIPDGSPSGRGVSAVHNHPRLDPVSADYWGGAEGPLSLQDILLGVAAGRGERFAERGYDRIAALASDGAALLPTGSVARLTGRGREFLSRPLMAEVLKLMALEARISGKNAQATLEGSLRGMDRAGILRYGSRYSPDTEAAFSSRQSVIDGVADRIVREWHPRVYNLPYPLRPEHLIAGGGSLAGGGAVAVANAIGGERPRKRGR